MNRRWNLALCGALAAVMLAGCGSKADGGGEQANAQAQVDAGAGQNGQGDMRGGMGMVDENGNAANLIGKVKSVNGQTITVYKSSIDPSQMGRGPGGPNSGGGQPPSGTPNDGSGQAQNDGQASGSTGAETGSAGTGGATGSDEVGNGNGGNVSGGGGANGSSGGNANGNGGGAGTGAEGNRPPGGGMANMFTDETVDITVTDATKIESTSFENGQATTKEIALADLKADDVITVWLKDGTQEATTIRLGGLGGGRGGRGGPQGGQQSQQGQQ